MKSAINDSLYTDFDIFIPLENTASFDGWEPGQPDEDGGSGVVKEEDCGITMFRFQENISWYDMLCSYDHLYDFDFGEVGFRALCQPN